MDGFTVSVLLLIILKQQKIKETTKVFIFTAIYAGFTEVSHSFIFWSVFMMMILIYLDISLIFYNRVPSLWPIMSVCWSVASKHQVAEDYFQVRKTGVIFGQTCMTRQELLDTHYKQIHLNCRSKLIVKIHALKQLKSST